MENNTESFRTHKQKPACLFHAIIITQRYLVTNWVLVGTQNLDLDFWKCQEEFFFKKWHTIVH